MLPSLKLTDPLKIEHWKGTFLLETIIFRGYVRFRECNYVHCSWVFTFIIALSIEEHLVLFYDNKLRKTLFLKFIWTGRHGILPFKMRVKIIEPFAVLQDGFFKENHEDMQAK